MGKSTGFMEYERQTSKEVPPLERIKNFNEFHEPLSMEDSANRRHVVWTVVCRFASMAR